MLLFSMSGVFAQNNETLSDDVSATIEQDDVFEVPQNQEVLSVEAEEPIIAESNNGISEGQINLKIALKLQNLLEQHTNNH